MGCKNQQQSHKQKQSPTPLLGHDHAATLHDSLVLELSIYADIFVLVQNEARRDLQGIRDSTRRAQAYSLDSDQDDVGTAFVTVTVKFWVNIVSLRKSTMRKEHTTFHAHTMRYRASREDGSCLLVAVLCKLHFRASSRTQATCSSVDAS